MKRDALRLAKDVLSSRRKRADGGTDEWQSTGKLVREDKSINWGDRDSAADFFRADKEQRLRDEAKLADRAEPAPAPKRTAEGRQMAPARVAPARSEEPAVEASLPVPATAPVRTAEGRQMAPDWEYQEPLNDEQRKALALQQWTAAGQKGTPDAPVRDMMAIKAPSSSFGQPSPKAPNFAAAQGITPGAPEWRRASLPQEGGGKYTNRVAPPVAPPSAPELPRQALSFGPMQDTPAPFASQSQADQVWQRMITQESGNRQFDRSGRPITSRAGALGIAQVMPGTGPEAARLAGLPWSLDRLRNDPEYNHALGRAYYDEQLRQFGNPVLAAAAYNGGPGRVTKALQLAARTNRPFTDFLKPETRDYVRIVASPSSRRPPLRFGTPEGYEEGGRVSYADEGAAEDTAPAARSNNLTSRTIAEKWTPPEDVDPRLGKFMAEYPAKMAESIAGIPQAIWDTVKYPGQLLYGEKKFDTDEAIKHAMEISGAAMTGSIPFARAATGEAVLGSAPIRKVSPEITRAQILARLIKSDPEMVKAIESSSTPEFLVEGLASKRHWQDINKKQYHDEESELLKSLPAALRWELAGRKPFDKGVIHYDISGGSQIPDIIGNQRKWMWDRRFEDYGIDTKEPFIQKTLQNQFEKKARIRAAELSHLNDENAFFDRSDYISRATTQDPAKELLRGKTMIYPNEYEGNKFVKPDFSSGNPKIRDIVNDPDLRKAYNLSLATPSDSVLHKKSLVFKSEGGIVDHAMNVARSTGGRTGYANEGAVDDQINQDQAAVYDPMGNVAVPAATTDPNAKEGLYDTAMKKVGAADDRYVGPMNASVWDKPSGPGDDRYVGPMAVSDLKKPPEPKAPEGTLFSRSVDPITRAIKTVSDDYRKNLAHHSESAAALQSQANKDSSGERGWQGRLLAPLESANSMMGTAFAPISAAATSVGHGATYLTGNPAFGQRAEFLANFIDPSHVGLAKVGAMKLGKIAEDVAPYSAMFLPVARTDPALATAKQLLAEGKTADEIKAATGIHFGPESPFGSYELKSNVPDEFGRYRREGVMPLQPESRPMKEISDENMVLSRDPANDIPLTQNQTIESYTFEHPELLKEFPEFSGMHQDIKVHPDFKPTGEFDPFGEIAPGQFGPKLKVQAPTLEEARSIVAHETQHFVSEVGGLEKGNNPESQELINFHAQVLGDAKQTAAKAQSEMDAYANRIVQDYGDRYNVDVNSTNGLMTLESIRKEAEGQWWDNLKNTDLERAKEIYRAGYIKDNIPTAYDMYQHMYGEGLARATQDRIDIPKAERDTTPLRFNFNEYQGKNQPDILTPIPEKNLFSDKDLADNRREIENIRQQLDEQWWKDPFASTPSASVSQSRPSPVEPTGNLNFRPSITTDQLKGPERQTAQSFLDQIKTRPGFSKDSIEELAAKFPDRNAIVTKAEFESAVPKSEYSKVDLQPEGAKALKEFNETVKGDFEANLPDVFSNLLYDWFKVDMSPAEAAELVKFQKGEINYEQLPENLVTKLKGSDIWRKQELKEVLDETYNKGYNDVWDTYLEHSDYSMENFSDKLYKYEDDQRLVVDPKKHENNYAELGLTHPNLKGDYSHFDNTSEKVGPLGGHFRRTNFPEGGDIISGRKGDLSAPTWKLPISEKYQTFKTKPKSTVIEEIQSDSQQSEKQVGPLRQIHGTVFKTAIQDALESGSTTVYMPTSKPILAARDVKPETRKTLTHIYDTVIPKEGINPLKEIPGVTVNKVADGAYHEIDFTPEAINYILKGPGQRTPGFKKGGAVERAMDISRFGTDAVQSAVNLARQHRGRPDS
jgi:hypothetical protein